MEIKNPNDVRKMMEIDDDELDMVAGGCGGNSGSKSSKSGSGSGSGKGKGKGGISYTCPFCKKTKTYASNAEAAAHVKSCPKNPNAC